MEARLCKNCSQSFVPLKRKDQLFCSKKCREGYFSNDRKERLYPVSIERKCLRCGVTFVAANRHYKFCSAECSDEHHKNMLKVPLRTFNCPICGIEFQGTQRKMFCSDSCRMRNTRNKKYGDKSLHLHRMSPKIRTEIRERVHQTNDRLCWLCKKPIEDKHPFIVHHLDGSGKSLHPNGADDNLVAVHTACHQMIHHLSILQLEGLLYIVGEGLKLKTGLDKLLISGSK